MPRSGYSNLAVGFNPRKRNQNVSSRSDDSNHTSKYLVKIDLVSFQQLTIFALKCLRRMMFTLTFYIIHHTRDNGSVKVKTAYPSCHANFTKCGNSIWIHFDDSPLMSCAIWLGAIDGFAKTRT